MGLWDFSLFPQRCRSEFGNTRTKATSLHAAASSCEYIFYAAISPLIYRLKDELQIKFESIASKIRLLKIISIDVKMEDLLVLVVVACGHGDATRRRDRAWCRLAIDVGNCID